MMENCESEMEKRAENACSSQSLCKLFLLIHHLSLKLLKFCSLLACLFTLMKNSRLMIMHNTEVLYFMRNYRREKEAF